MSVVTISGGNMTILLKKEITLTEDATPFIENYIPYVHSLNPVDLYEGKKDKQILKNKFIFQIYQLTNLDLANVSLDLTDKNINVLARFGGSEAIKLGSLPINDEIRELISQGTYPYLRVIGGNYKKVVTNEDDKDVIEDCSEPYGIILEFHEVDNFDYKSKQIDVMYHNTFKTERSLVNTSKVLMCCFALLGLIIGLGFMFLGFFATGLMVIIAFFGVNSYTLIISQSVENHEQPKHAN